MINEDRKLNRKDFKLCIVNLRNAERPRINNHNKFKVQICFSDYFRFVTGLQ